jgi:hypothetical protein
MKANFFSEMTGFHDFSDLSRDSHYVQAPEDWTVVITDVEGSTKAIQEGRYKTVNMVGAATVAAVVNAVGTRDLPFVFGGDGATALVPNECLAKVRSALAKSRNISQTEHRLNLRVGLVPHKDLMAARSPVRVAKYVLKKSNSLAFFKGTGLSLAESWVKAGKYLLPEDEPMTESDPHEGLSCRWAPLKNTRGSFLSVLIKIQDGKVAGSGEFAQRLLLELDQILDFNSPDANPVKAERLSVEKTFKAASLESSFQSGGWRSARFLRAAFFIIFVKALNQGILNLANFSMKKYKDSLASNSDYRKFDETIRMVVDCSPAMKRNVIALLEAYRQQGALAYGLHESATALMTCFVQNYEDRHVHFIDGGDGGYAMAARELKAQLK